MERQYPIPTHNMFDIVLNGGRATFPTNEADRASTLRQERTRKMARSAHAYVRGNTLRFYEWLDSVDRVAIPDGPPIWICGDCHIGNLGPISDGRGNLEIQIRDFDQTVVGNPANDIVRLALSLASAARGSDLPGVVTARMIEHVSLGYTDALAPRKVVRAFEKPSTISAALEQARRRTQRHLAAERLDGARKKIPLGKRFWAISAEERSRIKEMVERPEVLKVVTERCRRDAARVKMLDAAYWLKGCSSLGLLRYAVLMDVGKNAKTGESDFCMLDIKEAIKAVAPHQEHVEKMPSNNAKRVVAGANAMSPFLGARMHADTLLRHSVFVRELLPQDLKLEIQSLPMEQATLTAYYLARTVGIAHARQMDSATKRSWRRELLASHSKVIDAPPWLWKGVVELIASHERGYLDHCRRYALTA